MSAAAAPTIKDVAREAGVSLGTVSKVINGKTVGDAYRLRVEQAIDKLGYQVNTYARSLKTRKTNCVALLMPSLRHPFYAILTDEITRCLMRRGYRSLLMVTNFDPKAEQKCFDLVQQNKADGVIALTYAPNLEVDERIPIVTIDRHLGLNVPCVSSDNYAGGQLAAKTLLDLGCRKLLFFRIGPEVLGEPDKRGAGFESVCRSRNADYEMLSVRDEETVAPIYAFLDRRITGGKPDFDGIFCNTDGLAVQILSHLRARGVDVPGQVQVIGYDGMLHYASGAPYCSTIVQPIDQMAESAVDILLSTEGFPQPTNVCLPVRYLPGGTTRD